MPLNNTDLLELKRQIARAVLRLRIAEYADGSWEGGTAFMVSPWIALTAHHNLPNALLEGRKTVIQAVHADDVCAPLTFEWLPHATQERHDIAVLRLKSKPSTLHLSDLRPAWLPPDLPQHEAQRFWQGRRIALYGFPFRGSGQSDRWVVGILHTGQPVEQIDLGQTYNSKSQRLDTSITGSGG